MIQLRPNNIEQVPPKSNSVRFNLWAFVLKNWAQISMLARELIAWKKIFWG